MKKIILGTLLISSSAFCDSSTILPYGGLINYDNSTDGSAKDEGKIAGVYFSEGDLNHLWELDYARTVINYKDTTLSDLKQNDITLTYSRYLTNYMYKIGYHNISTSDTDLGDAHTLMLGIGGYKWKGYDKISYGLESYYTLFKDGHDDLGISKNIDILQLSPNFTYSKAINVNTRNNITLKGNYIYAGDYQDNNYFSAELEDTLYYKKFFTTASGYVGEMKTGIKSGAHTVYNTKDLLKNGYGLKVGYYFKPNLSATIGYSIDNFKEYQKTVDTSSSATVATLTYSF